jgi:hypothetical protein
LGHTQSEPVKINFNGISASVSLIAGRNQVKGWRENGQPLGGLRLYPGMCCPEVDQKRYLCQPRWIHFVPVGTLRFNSSNQFSTTLICVAEEACSVGLTIRNR